MDNNTKATLLLSGGLDSVCLAHQLHRKGIEAYAVSFDYGQRHRKELEYADKTADRLGFTHTILSLPLAGRSALLGTFDVPQGFDPDASTQKTTIVPNRNMAMLSLAATVGEGPLYVACNASDAAVYPDCRGEFLTALSACLEFVTGRVIQAPFVALPKSEIVRLYKGMGLGPDDSWSCYRGEDVPCGQCGPCMAIKQAGGL